MNDSPVDFVRARLERLRGQWKRIAHESGVGYTTIKNIMQDRTRDPRTSTIHTLREYLRRAA